MADEKQAIVIKKVQGGGHGGGHGGGWKVAFADFMTALMCFFLVMWLLGSDEEIQSAVSHYFNKPTSAWRPDLSSSSTTPLGEMTGAGDNVLQGMDGRLPEDLIERPSRRYKNIVVPEKNLDDVVEDMVASQDGAALSVDHLTFSIPEYRVFKPDSDELVVNADRILRKVGAMAKRYRGKLQIQGRSHEPEKYEFSITRVVAVKKFLVDNHMVDEDRVVSDVNDRSEDVSHLTQRAISDLEKKKRISFTLLREKETR